MPTACRLSNLNPGKCLKVTVDIGVTCINEFSNIKNYVVPARAGIQVRGSLAAIANVRFASRDRAGGCPAATHFLCFAKESKQRRATRVRRFCRDSAYDKNALRYSRAKAAAERALRIRFVTKVKIVVQSSDIPRRNLLRSLRCSAALNGNSKAHRAMVCLFIENVCRKLSPSPRKGKAGMGLHA